MSFRTSRLGQCLLALGSHRIGPALTLLLALATVIEPAQGIVLDYAEPTQLEPINADGNFQLSGTTDLLLPVDQADGSLDLSAGLITLGGGSTGPALAFSRDAQGILITWPAEASGYVLESSTRLDNPADWTPVSPAPLQNSYRVVPDAPARFFRLRR